MMLMKKKIKYIYILHLYHTRARNKRERERQGSGQTRGDIHKSKYIIRHEMLPWRTLHSYPDSFNNNIKNVPRDSLTSGQSTTINTIYR